MKKLLLAAATATVLSSSAMAAEDMFYVKANVGWDKLNKVQGFKSNNDVFFGVGAGYYVMDNVRADLTFDHYVNPTHKKDGSKIKGTVNTLLLNGYVDLFDYEGFKFFVGAGVGAGQVKAKVANPADPDEDEPASTVTAKQKTNLAFAGHVGVSYGFAEGVSGELAYSYRDMGKTKKTPGNDGVSFHYRGHHVAAGVRFDI